MKKAIYVRSALENELSVETQIEYCKLKLKPNDEYVVFSDNGYSSYDKEKPAFNEMMSAIERGEIDTVIIYRFNRVCRDLGSFTLFFKNLRYHNVEFISASEGLDSSNPLG